MKQRSYLKNIDEEALLEVSKAFGFPLVITKTITHFSFKKLKQLQRDGKFETLMLEGVGKWLVKPGMRRRILEFKDLKEKSMIAKEINKEQQLDI